MQEAFIFEVFHVIEYDHVAMTCQITVRAGGAHPPVSLNHFVLEEGHSLYASHQTFVVWQEK